MRLDINLATQPYEDSRRFWMRWGTGVALAGIITIALVVTAASGLLAARRDRDTMARMQNQIGERDQEKSKAQAMMNLPENRTVRDRSQFLNDLFQRKAFSWTKVFEELERVMPPELHVVSIHPEMVDNELSLKLVVAGQSHERALELVKKMEESQHFQETHIDQETTGVGQNPQDSIQFDITAQYVPDATPATTPAPRPAAKGKQGTP